MRPKWVARPPKEGGYGCTLHRDYDGEFDYNLQWKPVGGFPVTFGWIHASVVATHGYIAGSTSVCPT